LELEGVVAKRASSTYEERRSAEWLKIRHTIVDDFAIVGFASPRQRGRSGIRSLHLAARDGEEWVYAGRVGSGLGEAELAHLAEVFEHSRPCSYPFSGSVEGGEHHWFEPELVCEVRYHSWPSGLLLRQPVFERLRDDLDPRDCLVRDSGSKDPITEDIEGDADEERVVARTNLDKVFWPVEGYTKGDLIRYYEEISPWALPYLQGRPVVLTRYPDGIDGKSFFQKDAPEWVPHWIRTETMWSEHAKRQIHYFVCENVESLSYLANLGTIPLHVWSSRVGSLATPDWSIIDLDPKGAPFEHVVRCARAVRSLCQSIRLPCYVKSSGSSGLHILLPLAGQCTFEQSRQLAELVCRIVEVREAEIATTARSLRRREGKVYLDFGQNGHGRLLVAPFSVRPLPGAPVSMPLHWREVKAKLDIRRFHIKNAKRRMQRLSEDPLLPVLDERAELVAALESLGALLADEFDDTGRQS
jgi:bifunctional non-homologous end joining protein LigD